MDTELRCLFLGLEFLSMDSESRTLNVMLGLKSGFSILNCVYKL